MTLNPPSLVGRLTLRYTAYSTLLFVIVMIVAYFLTGQVLTGQVDADLIEDIEEFSETLRERGEVELWQELQAEVNSDGQLQILFQLYAMSGELLRNTDNGTWQNFNVSNDWPTSLAEDGYALSTVELQTHEFPARTIIGVLDSQSERVLLINESLEERAMVLEVLRLTFMLSLPLIVIGSLLGGRQMARKSLQGVQQVTDTAIDISNGDLSKRVQLNDQGIEIDRLAETFNSMLDKIQAVIRSMREMNDNIAHDLKSPLARIRGIAETTLTGDQDSAEYQQLAASTIEECDRLLHLINTMLDLAETEAGLAQCIEKLDLSELVEEACELYQPLAADHELSLDCELDHPIQVIGNRQFLQRMISNIIDNAIKYTPAKGSIRIRNELVGEDVLLRVSDTGIGIDNEDIGNIFQRFYRCDASRNEPGSGLGLSLAMAIAKAHRGSISVSSRLREGSEFTVRVPLAI